MSSAVITYCGHFFHGNCLRKWLYVQETCPMCHQTVRPTPSAQSQASGDAPAAPPQRDEDPDPVAQEGEQDPDGGSNGGTQDSNDSTPEQQQQQKKEEEEEEQSENKNQPAEPHSEAVRGFRFSSSGDFVGFVSPVSSGCNAPPGTTSNTHNHDEQDKDSPLPSNPDAVNENTAEDRQSDSELSGPEDGVALHCKSRIDSSEANNSEAGSSLAGSQTSVKSCHQNSENPQSHNGTISGFDGLREAGSSPQILRPSSSDATFTCTSTDSSD